MIQFDAFFGLDVHYDSITIGRITPAYSCPEVLITLPSKKDPSNPFLRNNSNNSTSFNHAPLLIKNYWIIIFHLQTFFQLFL